MNTRSRNLRDSHQSGRPCCTKRALWPLLGLNGELYWSQVWGCSSSRRSGKAAQTSCDYFHCLQTLFTVVSSLRTSKQRRDKKSGAWERRQSKNLLLPWETSCPFVSQLPPLLIVGGTLDPLTSARINLAKYAGYYCDVSIAAPPSSPSSPFTSLGGVDESRAPWETASLISLTNESPGRLHAIPASFH